MIFAGAPIWCGTISPPLAAWLYRNDLSGKVILPFYSHCGGVPCSMRQEVQRLCPGAQVTEALGVLDTAGPDALAAKLAVWLAAAGE